MSTSEQQADAGATSATQGRQVVVNVGHELDDLQSRAHREHVNEGSSGTANRKDNHRSAAVTDADEDVRFEVPVDGVEWNSFFNGVEMNRTPTDDEEDSLGMEEVIRRSHDSIVAMMSPVSSAVFRGSHDQGVGTMPVKKAVCYGVCSTDLSEPVHSIRCGKCSTNMKPIGYGHHARFRHDGEMIASFGSGHMSDDSESAFCIDHPDAADECQDFLLSPPHSYYGLPSTSATTPTTDCVTETEFLTERIAKSVPIVNKKKLQAISGKLSSNKLDKTKPGVVDTSSSYYVEQRHDLKIVVKRSPDKKPSFARHSEAPAFNPYQQLQHGHAAYAASLTPDARPPSAAGHPQHHLPPQQQQQAAAAAAAPSFSNFYGAPASSVSSGFGGGAPTSSFSGISLPAPPPPIENVGGGFMGQPFAPPQLGEPAGASSAMPPISFPMPPLSSLGIVNLIPPPPSTSSGTPAVSAQNPMFVQPPQIPQFHPINSGNLPSAFANN